MKRPSHLAEEGEGIMLATTTRTAAFIDALADPEAEYRFYQDPVSVMTEFGLSDDEQHVILHGSIEQIRWATGTETPAYRIKRIPFPRLTRIALRRG